MRTGLMTSTWRRRLTSSLWMSDIANLSIDWIGGRCEDCLFADLAV